MLDHEMEAEAERLINELLTRVGMIMEDTTITALMRDSERGGLRKRIMSLEAAAFSISSLIAAAKALHDG